MTSEYDWIYCICNYWQHYHNTLHMLPERTAICVMFLSLSTNPSPAPLEENNWIHIPKYLQGMHV